MTQMSYETLEKNERIPEIEGIIASKKQTASFLLYKMQDDYNNNLSVWINGPDLIKEYEHFEAGNRLVIENASYNGSKTYQGAEEQQIQVRSDSILTLAGDTTTRAEEPEIVEESTPPATQEEKPVTEKTKEQDPSMADIKNRHANAEDLKKYIYFILPKTNTKAMGANEILNECAKRGFITDIDEVKDLLYNAMIEGNVGETQTDYFYVLDDSVVPRSNPLIASAKTEVKRLETLYEEPVEKVIEKPVEKQPEKKTSTTTKKRTVKKVTPETKEEQSNAIVATKTVNTGQYQITNPATGSLILNEQNIRAYLNIPNDVEAKEIELAVHKCIKRGLDPLRGDVILTPYRNKDSGKKRLVLIETIESRLEIADQQPDFEGFRAGVLVQNAQGDVTEQEGEIVPKGFTLTGGFAYVFRKNKKPFFRNAEFTTYVKDNNFWQSYPGLMIRKTALAKALKEAYPSLYKGTYTREELSEDED